MCKQVSESLLWLRLSRFRAANAGAFIRRCRIWRATFDAVSARPRHERYLMAGYSVTSRCDGIAEDKECFWMPGCGCRPEIVDPQGNDREQSEQRTSLAQDRLVRPWRWVSTP